MLFPRPEGVSGICIVKDSKGERSGGHAPSL